jgi:hypothetical protein
MSIDAIKAVVDLIEMGGVVGQEDIVKCLRSAIEQAERQEPVATVTSETGADVTMSWWHEPALPVGTKLYTAPPQRQPLTDEEIADIAFGFSALEILHDDYAFARAIERKHGIGGGHE